MLEERKFSSMETLRSIRKYSEFFWTFTWRNIRLQYNNFWFGLFWGVMQPLLMSAIFYIALNNSVGVNIPQYFIYIYSGFIFWSVFSGSLSQAYVCFLQNDDMIKQIYFPRFLLPITFLAGKLPDLLIALVILMVTLVISGVDIQVGWFLIYSFLSLIQLLLVSIGSNLLFSVICVRYRGFQVVYPFMSQAIFFTSSILYNVSLSIENEWIRPIFEFNPISTILYTFRLGIFPEDGQLVKVVLFTLYAMVICALGYIWFKSEDKNLIDRL